MLTVLFNQGTTETASNQLAKIGVRFPYPKPASLIAYLVSIFTSDDSIILDFFSGSGTTFESVASLNQSMGGKRQAILVTNNELSVADARELSARGLRPGTKQWEAQGVFERATRPRVAAVVNGFGADGSRTGAGTLENVEFFTLTYEAPLTVGMNQAFARIAPMLWLRAGSRGRRINSLPVGWDVAEAYGVIERLEKLDDFVAALQTQPTASVAFIVTDDDRRFQSALAQLPEGVEPVRLYESYLRNFQIDAVRSTR